MARPARTTLARGQRHNPATATSRTAGHHPAARPRSLSPAVRAGSLSGSDAPRTSHNRTDKSDSSFVRGKPPRPSCRPVSRSPNRETLATFSRCATDTWTSCGPPRSCGSSSTTCSAGPGCRSAAGDGHHVRPGRLADRRLAGEAGRPPGGHLPAAAPAASTVAARPARGAGDDRRRVGPGAARRPPAGPRPRVAPDLLAVPARRPTGQPEGGRRVGARSGTSARTSGSSCSRRSCTPRTGRSAGSRWPRRSWRSRCSTRPASRCRTPPTRRCGTSSPSARAG